MQEGILSLLQIAKTSALLARLAQTKAPCLEFDESDYVRGDGKLRVTRRVIIAEPGCASRFRREACHRADYRAEAAG